MEVISLWKKTKAFFGLSIILNIITEKWGYREEIKFKRLCSTVVGLATETCTVGSPTNKEGSWK